MGVCMGVGMGVCVHMGVVLEESARSYNETRIRPWTYASVDRAYQAESVGSNFL